MPTSASTGPVPQAAEATQAANPTTRVFARPSASRVVSSGIFLVLLTTMGMTWVSLSVPGCYSDLTAREPIGVEIVGGTEVAATGHITSDCSFSFGAMCDEVQRVEGSFSIDGTAPVAALLAIVIAGTGLVALSGTIGFRLREGLALSGALLLAVVATSPESALRMSWHGSAARPDVDAGFGPVVGVGLFVAILFHNLVVEWWDRAKGRRALLVFLADAGFVTTCIAVVLLGTVGPVALLLVPVIPPLMALAGGRGAAPGPDVAPALAAEPASAGRKSPWKQILFALFAAFSGAVAFIIWMALTQGVVVGIIDASDRSDAAASPPASLSPTPTVPAAGVVPSPTATPAATATPSRTPPAAPTAAASPPATATSLAPTPAPTTTAPATAIPTGTPVPPTATRPPAPTATRTPLPPATPTPVRTPTATPTPVAGQFRLEGRASTQDGSAVVGIDVAIIKGAFRTDVTTGDDGRFTASLVETGTYRVAAVGVMCSQNNWFSDGGCAGYNLFVEVDVTAAVTVPGGEPVVLRYARATVVLEGEITDGPAAGVRAVRSDGAIAWSNSVAPDGRFRLGLTPGTWLLFARNFSPNVVDGPSIAVIVSADGSYPAITITAPPR